MNTTERPGLAFRIRQAAAYEYAHGRVAKLSPEIHWAVHAFPGLRSWFVSSASRTDVTWKALFEERRCGLWVGADTGRVLVRGWA